MKLAAIFVTLFLIWFLVGCSMTVSPDGARSFALDADNAARAFVTYSSK